MTDVVDKITDKVGPDDLDQFHIDMVRRSSLGDEQVAAILQRVFAGIDKERLTGEMSTRWTEINSQLSME